MGADPGVGRVGAHHDKTLGVGVHRHQEQIARVLLGEGCRRIGRDGGRRGIPRSHPALLVDLDHCPQAKPAEHRHKQHERQQKNRQAAQPFRSLFLLPQCHIWIHAPFAKFAQFPASAGFSSVIIAEVRRIRQLQNCNIRLQNCNHSKGLTKIQPSNQKKRGKRRFSLFCYGFFSRRHTVWPGFSRRRGRRCAP